MSIVLLAVKLHHLWVVLYGGDEAKGVEILPSESKPSDRGKPLSGATGKHSIHIDFFPVFLENTLEIFVSNEIT